MTLLLDIGNTRVKWRYLEGLGMPQVGFARHDGLSLPAKLVKIGERWSRLDRALVANVAGADMQEAVLRWVREGWGIEAEAVEVAHRRFGLTCGYRDSAQLGVDRWVAMIGARAQHGGAICVVDCGTAVTVDAVSEQGVHIGGAIFPGIRLMRISLATETGGLPRVEGAAGDGVLGRSTEACILKGTLFAVASTVNELRAKVEARLGGSVRFFLTGGDGDRIKSHLAGDYCLVPQLVLDGLAVIDEKMTAQIRR